MTQGTPNGWTAVVVRMPVELHDAVKRAAALEERSVAQTMRRAFREYCAATAHTAYANPVAGGWDGYQAACHDCGWTGTFQERTTKDSTDLKAKAHVEARAHEAAVNVIAPESGRTKEETPL